jgi:hypothetical protein
LEAIQQLQRCRSLETFPAVVNGPVENRATAAAVVFEGQSTGAPGGTAAIPREIVANIWRAAFSRECTRFIEFFLKLY